MDCVLPHDPRSHAEYLAATVVWRPYLVVALLAWLVGCDDPKPPAACGTVAEQTVNVRENTLVRPCFEDPEMGRIGLAAQSSDPETVTADPLREVIRLQGVSPGTATVTVTATDSDMLTAEVSFSVLVPNRTPRAHGAMPSARVEPGATAHWGLSDYFSEPDDQQLVYTSASSDARVASTSVSADTLTAVGGAPGTATVTITASDPGGMTATQQVVVTVVTVGRPPYETLFRDDFESEESLAAWAISEADPEIRQKILWLANTSPLAVGTAQMPLTAVEWEVTAEMGHVNKYGWATLIFLLEHDQFRAYAIQIGADDGYFELGQTNYRFFVWDDAGPYWFYKGGWSGVSTEIKRLGELTKVSMSVQGGSLTVAAGETELISVDLELAGFPSKMTEVILGVWPKIGDTPGVAVFDYVEVVGVPQGRAASDRHHVELDLSRFRSK